MCFAYQCKHLQIENPLSILGNWFLMASHYADGLAVGRMKMSAQAQQSLLWGSLLWHRQTSPHSLSSCVWEMMNHRRQKKRLMTGHLKLRQSAASVKRLN